MIEIEPDFEKNLINTGTASVAISANAVNGMKGSLGSNYAAQIMTDFSAQLRDEEGLDASITQLPKMEIAPRFLYNPTLDYKVYMVPALLAMLLIILVGFLPALNIVGEKEKGTIEQINVTPVGKIEFILSKLIPYAVVGMFMLTFAMLLVKGIHGIVPAGNIGLIYLFSLLFCVVVASMGLIISNYSSNTQQAALTFFFFMMICMLMSGLLTPVTSMPLWSRVITEINPMRFAMEAYRTLYMKNPSFASLLPQFLRLCVMAVVLWIWAIISYRKNN